MATVNGIQVDPPNYRVLASILASVQPLDLLLHPRRIAGEVRAVAAFATRTHHRSLEAAFFSNDTAKNRLGRDGFFDVVAAIRLSRLRRPRTAGRVLPERESLCIEFVLHPDADFDLWARRLTAVVESFNGDAVKETEILAAGGEEER